MFDIVCYQNDFPTVIMEPGEEWQMGQYKLQVEQTVPYGTWLKQSTLTITSNVSNTKVAVVVVVVLVVEAAAAPVVVIVVTKWLYICGMKLKFN